MTTDFDETRQRRTALGSLSFGKVPIDFHQQLSLKYKLYEPSTFYRKKAASSEFIGVMMGNLHRFRDYERPNPSLKIDDQIYYLFEPEKRQMDIVGIDGRAATIRNPPTIRDSFVLRNMNISCPYKYAREAAASAMVLANRDTEEYFFDIEYANFGLKEPIEAVSAARNHLANLLHQHSAIMFDEIRERNKAGNAASKEEYFEPIERSIFLLNALLNEFESVPIGTRDGKPTEVWNKSYIERMGYAWYFLTCRPPRVDDKPFSDFLTSGVATVYQAYNQTERSIAHNWKNDIKYVIKRVEAGRGWAFYEPEARRLRAKSGLSSFEIKGYSRQHGYVYIIERNGAVGDYSYYFGVACDLVNGEEINVDKIANICKELNIEFNLDQIKNILEGDDCIEPHARVPLLPTYSIPFYFPAKRKTRPSRKPRASRETS
jgi:hypothetical protein